MHPFALSNCPLPEKILAEIKMTIDFLIFFFAVRFSFKVKNKKNRTASKKSHSLAYLIIINYSLHGNISTSNFEFNGGKCKPRVYKQI